MTEAGFRDPVTWGRQKYSGQNHPWHLMTMNRDRSRCGWMRDPHPQRLEIITTSAAVPPSGKICKRCRELVAHG